MTTDDLLLQQFVDELDSREMLRNFVLEADHLHRCADLLETQCDTAAKYLRWLDLIGPYIVAKTWDDIVGVRDIR
jgi:hypothetical protein